MHSLPEEAGFIAALVRRRRNHEEPRKIFSGSGATINIGNVLRQAAIGFLDSEDDELTFERFKTLLPEHAQYDESLVLEAFKMGTHATECHVLVRCDRRTIISL